VWIAMTYPSSATSEILFLPSLGGLKKNSYDSASANIIGTPSIAPLAKAAN